MPNDVPPRPGAPGYDEFIAHQTTSKDATKAGASTDKTNTQTPAAAGPVDDKGAVQGGLY